VSKNLGHKNTEIMFYFKSGGSSTKGHLQEVNTPILSLYMKKRHDFANNLKVGSPNAVVYQLGIEMRRGFPYT
jgi:hypothetical protein